MKKRIPVFLALLMLLSSLLVGAQGEAASVRLDSQSGHWALPAGIALSGSTLKLPYGGVAVYTGQEVGDEYVEYTQRIEAPGDWIGLQMRQADPAQDAFKQDCYMFRFDQTMVQLHKTSGGQFGELTAAIPTTVFADGQDHAIRARAAQEGAGIRLELYVDGTKLIDFLDETAPLTNSSYVSLFNYNNAVAVFTLHDPAEGGEPEEPVDAEIFRPYDKKDYWNTVGQNALSGSSMQLPYGAVAVYAHENLGNRLVEMDVQIQNDKWVAIQMRQADPAQDAFKQDCYMFRLSKTMVKLHKSKAATGLTGEIQTDVFADGQPHTVQAGAISDGNAVRLILYVDGVKLIDYTDASDPFLNDTPFSLYNYEDAQAVFTLESYDPRQDIVDDGLGYTGGEVQQSNRYPAFKDGNVTKEPETTGAATTATAGPGGSTGAGTPTTGADGSQPGTGVPGPSPAVYGLAAAGLLAAAALLAAGRKCRKSGQ